VAQIHAFPIQTCDFHPLEVPQVGPFIKHYGGSHW